MRLRNLSQAIDFAWKFLTQKPMWRPNLPIFPVFSLLSGNFSGDGFYPNWWLHQFFNALASITFPFAQKLPRAATAALVLPKANTEATSLRDRRAGRPGCACGARPRWRRLTYRPRSRPARQRRASASAARLLRQSLLGEGNDVPTFQGFVRQGPWRPPHSSDSGCEPWLSVPLVVACHFGTQLGAEAF